MVLHRLLEGKKEKGEESVPKLTNKERDGQLQWLTSQVANLNRLLGVYVEYKGDSVDFQKHLIDLNEEMKKKEQNDTKADTKSSDKANSEAV